MDAGPVPDRSCTYDFTVPAGFRSAPRLIAVDVTTGAHLDFGFSTTTSASTGGGLVTLATGDGLDTLLDNGPSLVILYSPIQIGDYWFALIGSARWIDG